MAVEWVAACAALVAALGSEQAQKLRSPGLPQHAPRHAERADRTCTCDLGMPMRSCRRQTNT
eukprot:10173743-Alexandrium_andersonii.AAC.1